MISFKDLSLQRGTKILLSAVNLTIHATQKVGVIGANGCGKSSIFSMLRNELQPDAGTLFLPSNLTIAHVAQETPAVEISALDYVLAGDEELCQVEAQLETALTDNDANLIAHLHTRLSAIDGYSARARAARLLHGLGFAIHSETRIVSEFSGGWRMRLNLARALMCRSDLLLLDEPTNHLDLDAVLWLEEWLRSYTGTLILISHDRDFLDNVVSHIVQVDQQQLTLYTGNYSRYEVQRASQLALQQATFEKQQRQRAHLQNYVDRFRAQATKARQAQSRIKALDRMEIISAAHVDSPFDFSFLEPHKNPNPLLRLEKVSVGYDDVEILHDINISIAPGMRLGLLGPNGAGKSTFIKLLAGEIIPRHGTRETHDALKVGYFAQHQLEQLRPHESPVQHLQALDSRTSEQQLRNFLGGFGFVGDVALTPIGPFSGGEKSRLALALLVWQRPNLLLLDEPTNHLDLEMRHALTLALQSFQGAMIIVSHDRHLLRTTTDSLLLVASGSMQAFDGDQDDYQRWLLDFRRKQDKKLAATPVVNVTPPSRQQKRESEAKIKKLEQQLDKLHAEAKQIEAALDNSEIYSAENKEQLARYYKKQTEINAQLQQVELDWLSAQEENEQP